MLNPNTRSLYTAALTPPPGMVFDEAIAAAFSMDPTLLLEAPVFLAMMAGTGGAARPDPIAVLEAVRRYSGKITAYVQRGRIHVPASGKPSPLLALLEAVAVEVNPPGGGVFHPKVWAIRFCSFDRSDTLIRLVILSRNLTADRAWDLSLQLEGTPGNRKVKANEPLCEFFSSLPLLAKNKVPRDRREQAGRFSEELRSTHWVLPEGFDDIEFFLPGVPERGWRFEGSERLLIVSPFCSPGVLRKLQESTRSPLALISRPETLQSLPQGVLDPFGKCLHLHEAAETEDSDPEEPHAGENSAGLHAKAYIYETKRDGVYTHVVVGSANATDSALLAGRNVEILAKLTGRRNRVGGIDAFLGADGLGEVLVPFERQAEAKHDTDRQEAEACLEKARALLVASNLRVRCTPSDREGRWVLILQGELPQPEGITRLRAWPITLQADHAVDLLGLGSRDVELGHYSASSITGLIAFELRTSHHEVSARFVMNLPVEGIPAERDAAILQTVINNQEGFIRYLLLLLGDEREDGDAPGWEGGGFRVWLSQLAQGEDVPLLEELTRAYSRHPARLQEIARLIADLAAQDNQKKSVIPEGFLALWNVYEQAMKGRS